MKHVLMYQEADKLDCGNVIQAPGQHEPPSFVKPARVACRKRWCAEKVDCWLPALPLEVVCC